MPSGNSNVFEPLHSDKFRISATKIPYVKEQMTTEGFPMMIFSYRQQVIADHSATNYLFYSPQPLSKQARSVVSKLSSHPGWALWTMRQTTILRWMPGDSVANNGQIPSSRYKLSLCILGRFIWQKLTSK